MKDLIKDRGVQSGAIAALSAFAATFIPDSRLSRLQRAIVYALIAALSAGLAAKIVERPSDTEVEK